MISYNTVINEFTTNASCFFVFIQLEMKIFIILYLFFIISKIKCETPCWSSGLCLGHSIQVFGNSNKEDCLEKCRNTPGCRWASIMLFDMSCHLSKSCNNRVLFEDYEASFVECEGKFQIKSFD